MEGCFIAMGFATLGFVTKAVLEAVCFKDRDGAIKSLRLWIFSLCCIGVALGFTLLIDHF